MKIIGLRIEQYIGQNITGHNCDFEYYDEVMDKHILCGIDSNGQKVEIELRDECGECCSGWTTASWGLMDVKKVSNFKGYTHRPIKPIVIDDFDYESTDVNNDVFSVSHDGGCNYYPSGCYNVNMDLFKETVRHKDKRPVWVFKGESNLGKSFIASNLDSLSVYETDTSNELPNIITEDVIVLGNKYTYDLEDIDSRILGEHELIIVKFNAII